MSKEAKKKTPVFGYIRKSTEDNQEGQSRRQRNSLPYQRQTIKEIAKKNGLRIVRVFEDSKTGYKAFVREGLEEMLGEFEKQGKDGPIQGIVCTEHNRLARNFGDGGLILWYLQDGLIKSIHTHDKIFTDSTSDQMMLAISFAMAKYSSDETRFRAKRTWRQKATEGQPPNQHLTGYKYVGEKGKKVWKVDPKNGPIIKDMFERFSTGKYSVTEIYEYVNNKGLTSVRTKKPYKSEKSIRELLKKKEYTGIFTFEGEEYSGTYPPLIDAELFYKVQEVLEGTSHPKKMGKNEYAYIGLVKCAVCGGNMSGTTKKGITYYRCLNRAEPCKSNKNKRPSYLREDMIDEKVTKLLRDIQISEKKFKKLSSYVSDIFDDEKASYRRELIQLKTKLRDAEELFKDYSKELAELKRIPEKDRDQEWGLNVEGYKKLRVDASERIESLKRVISKTEDLKEGVPSMMFNFLESIKTVGSRFKSASPSNKRAIVDTLCANFKWDGEKLSWEWKEPYHMLTDSDGKGDWLRE